MAQPQYEELEQGSRFRIGIADQDARHRRSIARGGRNGRCPWYEDGMKGARILVVDDVPDVSMPHLDGFQTLERIRDLSEVPVLMLTARGDELERVRGLQSGADDYVVKPFGRQELVARVQALLRRAGRDAAQQQERYVDDRLAIDFAQRAVTFDGEAVALTPLEFKLLG